MQENYFSNRLDKKVNSCFAEGYSQTLPCQMIKHSNFEFTINVLHDMAKRIYRKWGKIRWAKLSRFCRGPRKFFREYFTRAIIDYIHDQ